MNIPAPLLPGLRQRRRPPRHPGGAGLVLRSPAGKALEPRSAG